MLTVTVVWNDTLPSGYRQEVFKEVENLNRYDEYVLLSMGKSDEVVTLIPLRSVTKITITKSQK